MTTPDYDPFVDRMIDMYEGGYGWNKSDPGGPTKDGITCYDLADFMGKPMNSMTDWAPIVAAMPLTTAETIYQTKYATATRFFDMNAGKDCFVFDTDVNSGTVAILLAQRVVGVAQDRILGPVTFAAIQAYDPVQFIDNMANERMAFLEGLDIWEEFKGGWTARVTDLTAYCKNLILPPASQRFMARLMPPGSGRGKAYDKVMLDQIQGVTIQ